MKRHRTIEQDKQAETRHVRKKQRKINKTEAIKKFIEKAIQCRNTVSCALTESGYYAKDLPRNLRFLGASATSKEGELIPIDERMQICPPEYVALASDTILYMVASVVRRRAYVIMPDGSHKYCNLNPAENKWPFCRFEWSSLPMDAVKLILSNLSPGDMLEAMATCKLFYDAGTMLEHDGWWDEYTKDDTILACAPKSWKNLRPHVFWAQAHFRGILTKLGLTPTALSKRPLELRPKIRRLFKRICSRLTNEHEYISTVFASYAINQSTSAEWRVASEAEVNLVRVNTPAYGRSLTFSVGNTHMRIALAISSSLNARIEKQARSHNWETLNWCMHTMAYTKWRFENTWGPT